MKQCSLPKQAPALTLWLRAEALGVTVQTGMSSQGLLLPPHEEPGIPLSVSPSLGGETRLAQAHSPAEQGVQTALSEATAES